MMMPAVAPSTPASQEPAVSTWSPSYSLVCSPKYHTLPSVSSAIQSKVSSSSTPSSQTTSWTTRVVTPSTTRVRAVTVTTLVSVPSAVCPTYRHTRPTGAGYHGLSISSTKSLGAGACAGRPPEMPTSVLAEVSEFEPPQPDRASPRAVR